MLTRLSPRRTTYTKQSGVPGHGVRTAIRSLASAGVIDRAGVGSIAGDGVVAVAAVVSGLGVGGAGVGEFDAGGLEV